MFAEEYERLTRAEQNQFSEVVNNLLYECYILRKVFDNRGKTKMFKMNPDYLFIERHYDLISDYLSYLDINLVKIEEDGIYYVTSGIDKNHLRCDVVTTLIVYALRSS